MKTSSAAAGPRVIDRPTAWACLLTNVATLPGLGTIAAGHRVGYVQAVIAVIGFILSMAWFGLTAKEWWATNQIALGFTPTLGLGVAGVAVYGIAWIWALTSSLRVLRSAPPAIHATIDIPTAPPRL